MQTIIIIGTFMPKPLSIDDFITVSLKTGLLVRMCTHKLPLNRNKCDQFLCCVILALYEQIIW